MDRVTVEQAARILGIKEESVRKRVSRGTLRADKDEDGRLLVYVDGTGTVRDESEDRSVTDADEQPDLARELIEEMRNRIGSLEHQLAEERESRRRADTIIAQLTQANAALAQRVPELPAAQEPPGAAESAGGDRESAEPRSSTGGTQTGYERPRDTAEFPVGGSLIRPWWRRVFGG